MVYHKKKVYKKRAAPSTKRIAKIAKKVVLSNVDTKVQYISVSAPLGAYAGVAVISPAIDPSNIANGILFNNRDSDNVKIKKLDIGFEITPGGAVPQAHARLMLVRWTNSNLNPIQPLLALQWSNVVNGALTSAHEHNSPYRVLFDKLVPFGIQNGNGRSRFKKTLRFKSPLLIKYLDNSITGTSADIQSGLLVWLLVSSDLTGTFTMSQTTTFYDT